ncbi:MAG: hypothetical protein H0V53_03245 [Rubrobacter sp.]|nr:hypothetical protein [Rubrobacter sp.]
MRARPPRAALLPALTTLFLLLLASCGPSPALQLEQPLDRPSVYRVSTTAESWFSGPISDLEAATDLTAVFELTPASDGAVEVETLYVAASVGDSAGDPVSLGLGSLAGTEARIEMDPPGMTSGVTGDRGLLEADVPLVSMEEVLATLLPPLPQEPLRADDNWTADVPVAFANLADGPETRMRYVLTAVDAADEEAQVGGYELSTGPKPFTAQTAGGEVTGRGHVDVEFEGEYVLGEGYRYTGRTEEFDSEYLRLGGSSYANGNLHMRRTTTTERLSPAEQFGLDP